jgi:outer membrane immunogenic protein
MRLLRGALAALALSVSMVSSAGAADLPVKARPVVPVVVDYWTGYYVGVNGGYSWGRWNSTSLANVFPGPLTTHSPKVDGWLFGGQAGYNWRFDPHWVVGIEGDLQWTGERASSRTSFDSPRIPEVGGDFNNIFTTTTEASWKFPWFGTLRGRLGWLADPTLLLYGTGGLAVGNFRYGLSSTVTCQRFGPGSTGTTPQSTPCGPDPARRQSAASRSPRATPAQALRSAAAWRRSGTATGRPRPNISISTSARTRS